ncbi:glycosyltransferase family 4 protein [Thermostilla marina]
MQPVDQLKGTIVHLISGAGDRYCGSCLFAATLVRALESAGCRSVVYPLYTPVHGDVPIPNVGPLFFGGLNVYLQQRFAFFRKTPRWLDAWLDRPGLLSRLAGASTGASKATGEILLSMLAGEDGRQRKELDRLLATLAATENAAVVHLSNALLIGIAKSVRDRLGTPVVCSVTGEDSFLESLPSEIADEARERMMRLAVHLDAVVAASPYYAERMRSFLDIPREKVHVVLPAVVMPEGVEVRDRKTAKEGPVRVGFLGNITPEKGVDLAVEAFCRAASEPGGRALELAVAGRLDRPYRRFWDERMRLAASRGIAGRIVYHGELTPREKWEFLSSLDLMLLPSRYGESKGTVMLEAAMCGVPSLVPRRGAFSDWLDVLKSGWHYTEDTPAVIADRLIEVVSNREALMQAQRQVRETARQVFTIERLGRDVRGVYERVTAQRR